MGRAKAERIPTGVWNIRCSNACYSSVSLAYYFITDRNCGLYLYEFQCVSLFSFSFFFIIIYVLFLFFRVCMVSECVRVCLFSLLHIHFFTRVYLHGFARFRRHCFKCMEETASFERVYTDRDH